MKEDSPESLEHKEILDYFASFPLAMTGQMWYYSF